MMSILKELQKLEKEGVISNELSLRIRDYYQNQNSGQSTNRLLVIFGILGAILIGLGIILIVAHNWDEFPRLTKTIFAFIPVLIGQFFCAITLIKKRENVAWREGSAVFLFFSIGSSISLVSQIYHIPGNISSFVFSWMLLCFPLIYLMKSSVASLLYLIGITYYVIYTGYFTYPPTEPYDYWFLLSLMIPHYYLLFKNNPLSNFLNFHHWLVPLSIIISLGTLAKELGEFMYIAYISLFGLFFMIGDLSVIGKQNFLSSGYKLFGIMGTLFILLILSFDWFWVELRIKNFELTEIFHSLEIIISFFVTLIATGILIHQNKGKPFRKINPFSVVFLLFMFSFILGLYFQLSVLMINLIILGLGTLTILDGAKRDHLGILNFGLIIITLLVICRFFDTNISFVWRGLMFLIVGAGFFVSNFLIIKKRKTNEK